MSNPIYIYGAGGLGREVSALLLHLPEWSLNGFYDDNLLKGNDCDGVPCLGNLHDLLETRNVIQLVLAFGDPGTKLRISKALAANNLIQFPTLIHPSVSILNTSSIKFGAGCIVTAGAALTTNIDVGRHTLINLNVTIGHDVHIGESCSIMPGANLAGDIRVGDGVLIGSGANILNRVRIGSSSKVGAGAVVTKDVRANVVVVGIPAKELLRK